VLFEQLKWKNVYAFLLLAFLLFFNFADSHATGRNRSEKKAILEIAASDKHTVLIRDYCTIMSYRPVTDSLNSLLNTELLHYWGVLDREKLYYQVY
jgi:hypothetical protein